MDLEQILDRLVLNLAKPFVFLIASGLATGLITLLLFLLAKLQGRHD